MLSPSRTLIATDLDGTFLGANSELIPANIDAIAAFCAEGGLFTIATGRLPMNLVTIPSPHALLNAPAIMGNGSCLYDFTSNTSVREALLPAETARALLDFAEQKFPEVQFRVSTKNLVYMPYVRGFLKKDLRFTTPDILKVAPTDTWQLEGWYKIVFRQEPHVLAPFREALLATFGDSVTTNHSGPRSLEVQAANTSKATGLVALADWLEQKEGYRRTVIACGDYENDIPLLSAADVAICPSNAMPAVKEICHRTLCHHTEGLIADIIHRLHEL